ncbi:MAG: hypothetical protein AAGH89_00360 [Verrucomicrobiota bacterium]
MTGFLTKLTSASVCIASALAACSVEGQNLDSNDKSYPRSSGNVIFRLGYNGFYDSDAPRIETNDIFLQMIASPELSLTKRLSIRSEFRIEDLRPPMGDRFFEDEGFFVRSLYLQHSVGERLAFHAGKFTPSYALASLVTPGMYGNDYNKEIELIERVGFGGSYTYDSGSSGKHKLSVSTFFDDTSFLSDSLGSSPTRGPKRLSDGGASNTESFESFTVSLEGTEMSGLPGLTYKFGVVHEAKGEGDISDETGLAAAAMQTFQFGNGRSLTLMGEFAPLWNFEGSADDIIYSSAGVVYQSGRWTFIVSGTHRWRDLATGGSLDDYSLQTSVEYDLRNDFALAFAHEFTRDQNVNANRIGFRFVKVFDW